MLDIPCKGDTDEIFVEGDGEFELSDENFLLDVLRREIVMVVYDQLGLEFNIPNPISPHATHFL